MLLVFGCISRIDAQDMQRPKLVIGIVLDQMRWDYLYRYYDRFGPDGFKRLMKDGFNCERTYINYLPTFTAPGHSCIYTGSVPAIHGIAANDWLDIKMKKNVYCTEDKTVQPVGGGKDGLQSPRNLLATTITDELKLATNFRSRVYGVAIKDRGAILPAGHAADGAFWFESASGKFISSSFYMDHLPEWLNRFNNRNVTDSLLRLDWHTSFDIASYNQSTPDLNQYEGTFKYEQQPTFPHHTSKDAVQNRSGIKTTPQGNTMTRMLAEELILEEGLGKSPETDFLAVSFSSTDYIGHMYGPNSVEIEDMYIKMDQELALFLKFLDHHVGKGQYTLFLSADHAGAHNPVFLKDNKIPAGSYSEHILKKGLKELLGKEYDSNLVMDITNYQVYIDEAMVINKGYDRGQLIAKVKSWLLAQEGISMVIDLQQIGNEAIPQEIKERAINGYHLTRSGSIQIIMEPGWYHSSWNTGTTHGTWNPYDAHIPLIWYGAGIPAGKTYRKVYMTDIAPTLAALLQIQEPNGNIGNVITEIFQER